MKIKGKLAISLCLIGFVTLPFCSPKRGGIRTIPGTVYHSLRMKVKVKNEETGQKQSIKVLIKYNESGSRMLFLGPPLNKVYARLLVQGESALLINSKKKVYWRGDFIVLLRRMWDMDLDFADFKELILNGSVPFEKKNHPDMVVHVEMGEGGNQPSLIQVTGNLLSLEMKISGHKSLPGTLSVGDSLSGLERVALDTVLEQEE